MATRKTARGTAAAVKPKPDEWGVRVMPKAAPVATFASRQQAESYLRGEHAHDSNVIVHLDGGEWVDVAPHELEVTEFPYLGREGAAGCKSLGCGYYRSLKVGMMDPALSEADFRRWHLMAGPGDVAEAEATTALGEAMESLAELESLAGLVRKGLADPEKRLGEADWWDDHSQGLSYTARKIEGRLQVYLALVRAAHTERLVAEGD